GGKVPARARRIEVLEFNVTAVDLPLVSFRVRVSKGTYIRSLAADLGRRLRTGACLESLRRLASAPFHLDQAVGLEEAERLLKQEQGREIIIDLDTALAFLPEVVVPSEMARLVENGRPLPVDGLENYRPRPGPVRVQTRDRRLLAVYEYNPPGGTGRPEYLRPLRVLAWS
ncbi:MAG: tRNA pseudouridine(55) synthase TruB, partial [Thermodesulfobacteriota bacterium]